MGSKTRLMAVPSHMQKAIRLCIEERKAQLEKWGHQNHPPAIWHLVIGEEVGELAEAILDLRYSNTGMPHVKAEAVQVATSAIALIEWIEEQEELTNG